MVTRTRVPSCPVVHHGLMAAEPDCRDGSEWVCRTCGRRLYTIPPAPLKIGRADQLQQGELRSWVKRLMADGFTTGAIARIVDRDSLKIRRLVIDIAAKGE